MDNPVPFLEVDRDGKWFVSPKAKEILRNISTPLSSIAIVGKYRTGKSYLMNRLAGRISGFALGSTVQSKTKGIWMLIRKHPKNPDISLVLLDTEGLKDAEKGDETHDMQIFTFALLLSSCFVFNSTGTIDNAFIQELQMVSELTEFIKTKKTNERETGVYYATYFPCLVVVVRDFFLELKKEEREMTPDEYLENSLKLRENALSRKDRDYNAPRQCIKLYFKNRQCFTLPKPVENEEDLRNLDDPRVQSRILPKFNALADAAIDTIFSEAKQMSIDGNIIRGSGFLELAEMYTTAFNNGTLPCIESAVDSMIERECNAACEKALQQYTEQMTQAVERNLPLGVKQLQKFHTKYYNKACDFYRNNSHFDKTSKYVSKLQLSDIIKCIFGGIKNDLEMKYQEWCIRNADISTAKSHQAVEKCFAELAKDLENAVFTKKGGYKDYKKKRGNAEANYKRYKNLGPKADEILHNQLEKLQDTEHAILAADGALTESEKEAKQMEEELARKKEKEELQKKEMDELKENQERQEKEHQDMIQRLKEDHETKSNAQAKENEELLAKRKEEFENLLDKKLFDQAEEHKMIIAKMEEDIRKNRESASNPIVDLIKGLGEVATGIAQVYVGAKLGPLGAAVGALVLRTRLVQKLSTKRQHYIYDDFDVIYILQSKPKIDEGSPRSPLDK